MIVSALTAPQNPTTGKEYSGGNVPILRDVMDSNPGLSGQFATAPRQHLIADTRIPLAYGQKVNPMKLHPNLRHGWHLCGAGPARFGWAWAHPCSLEWLANTKKEALVVAQEKGLIK